MHRSPLPTPLRYSLHQLPAAIVITIAAWQTWRWQLLPGWVAVVTVLAWIAKDALLYPFVRRGYEPTRVVESEALIGLRAVAYETMQPDGYVRVRGELWRARLEGADSIESGVEVEVRRVMQGRLIVRPLAGPADPR